MTGGSSGSLFENGESKSEVGTEGSDEADEDRGAFRVRGDGFPTRPGVETGMGGSDGA